MAGKVNKFGLTEKQENACKAYIECGGNQSEAYRRAYNAENMTQKSIWEKASGVFSLVKVSERVIMLQESHAKRHNVTVDTITDELDEARKLAKDIENPTAMTGATMGKAKIHGLITDKIKHEGSIDLKSMSDNDLQKIINGD